MESQKLTITFATSNKQKLEQFQQITGNKLTSNQQIEYINLDLDEIQGTCEEVAIAKVKSASLIVKGPTLVEDESLQIEALNGFPGPYLKDFEKSLLANCIYKSVLGYENKICYPQTTYAFTMGPNKPVQTFLGWIKCKIVKPRDGNEFLKNYQEVIQAIDREKHMSDYTLIEDAEYNHRKEAVIKLIDFFIKI